MRDAACPISTGRGTRACPPSTRAGGGGGGGDALGAEGAPQHINQITKMQKTQMLLRGVGGPDLAAPEGDADAARREPAKVGVHPADARCRFHP